MLQRDRETLPQLQAANRCYDLEDYTITSGQLLKALPNRYIKQLMRDAGLKVRVDGVGNTYGLWEGTDLNSGTNHYHTFSRILASLKRF